MKTKVKIPAKINLTLDILGTENNYHNLSSLCASINLYDTVTLKKRNDNVITLTEKGIKTNVLPTENNAFKAGKLFMETFHVNGVDITVDKRIPIGGGLGGSSADISGVLNAYNELFSLNAELKPLADSLGSDTAYMLKGGYAVLTGRGEKVKYLKSDATLYLILVANGLTMTAKEAYSLFDKEETETTLSTENAVNALNADVKQFCGTLKNDLYRPVATKLPKLKETVNALQNSGALKALMTGSGSVVYGIYENKRSRDLAYKKLRKVYSKKELIKANTLTNKI